jgi:hypothetical protein
MAYYRRGDVTKLFRFLLSPYGLVLSAPTDSQFNAFLTPTACFSKDLGDRLCGLVVRVLGPGSIPGTTRFSGKKKKRKQQWVWSGNHSAS